MASHDEELDYAGGGLKQETNWWGAFVIGLAGTILVTGIAPVMVTTLGASAIPVIIFITVTGYLLCLLLAELSAMMPERTGGSPSYAYPAFREKWPRSAIYACMPRRIPHRSSNRSISRPVTSSAGSSKSGYSRAKPDRDDSASGGIPGSTFQSPEI